MRESLESIFCKEYVIGGLILLFGILILSADSEISDFNNKLLLAQNYQNNLLINANADLTALNQYQSYIALNVPIDLKNFKKNQSIVKNPKLNKIFEDFHSGLIDRNKFLNEASDFYGNSILDYQNEYDRQLNITNDQFQKGTPWSFWRKTFIIFQTLLIVLNMLKLKGIGKFLRRLMENFSNPRMGDCG